MWTHRQHHDRCSIDKSECEGARNVLERGPFGLFAKDSTRNLDYPVLYADCVLDAPVCEVKCREQDCHAVDKWIWCDPPQTPTSSIDYVLTRLLFPFADVVCLLADELGGLVGVVNLLTRWCEQKEASMRAWQARPRVIVISHQPDLAKAQLDQEYFRAEISPLKFRSHFSDITIGNFRIDPSKDDPDLCCTMIAEGLEHSREKRRETYVLFNARHTSQLFSMAVRHLEASSDKPFNYIVASRSLRPLSSDFSDQLDSLTSLCKASKVSWGHYYRLIASAILIDAYPPSSHCALH